MRKASDHREDSFNSVYNLLLASRLFTKIPLEFSICDLLTKLVAKTHNKPYT